jgi:hypothetical protein
MDIYERGITTGTSTEPTMLFSPDAPLTRAQFVSFLGRLAEVDVAKYSDEPPPFKDINPAASMTWSYGYICWAAETKITTGTGDGTVFDPQGELTREQMATMVLRFVKFYGLKLDAKDAAIADLEKVNDWAKDAVKALVPTYINLVDGNFQPQEKATRARMAQILSLLEEPEGGFEAVEKYVNEVLSLSQLTSNKAGAETPAFVM